jgi:hypothetical protein
VKPALSWLQRLPESGLPLNDRHYEAITKLWPHVYHNHLDALQGTGKWRVMHPTRPSADENLEYFVHFQDRTEAYQQLLHAQEFCQNDHGDISGAFFNALIRTAQVLKRAGRGSEARMLLGLGHDRRPHLFHTATYTRYSFNGARPKRKPTSEELERGVTLDDEGYVDTTQAAANWRKTLEFEFAERNMARGSRK